MKALVYNGPRNVTVQEVPDATIERPTDVLVKITTTNICGSDLHMYEGRTEVEPDSPGHENLGQVIEIGTPSTRLRSGTESVCRSTSVADFAKTASGV